LFSAQPVIVTGRYTGAAKGTLVLRGRMSGQAFERRIPVQFAAEKGEHDVLAKLWARTRIGDLMSQDYAGIQQGTAKPELRAEITRLGMEHRLVTQFTSFVAVEEQVVTEGGKPRRVDVPVEMPEGVSYEGVFGDSAQVAQKSAHRAAVTASNASFSGGRMAYDRVANEAPASPYRNGPAQTGPGKKPVGQEESDEPESARGDRDLLTVARLDPLLASLLERQRQGRLNLSERERRFVADGKAAVEVWLADATPEVLMQLKQLGFEQTEEPKVAKILTGRIALDKLEALAKLAGVRYVKAVTR
jgi:Ca-activated chloride channel family protein